jgi:hypothetical protein
MVCKKKEMNFSKPGSLLFLVPLIFLSFLSTTHGDSTEPGLKTLNVKKIFNVQEKQTSSNGKKKLTLNTQENIKEETRSSLGFGVNLTRVYYIEDLPPPTDSESGLLVGINLGFVSYAWEPWMLKLNSDFNMGKTRYDGALQDGTPLQSTTNDLMMDGEIAMGRTLIRESYYRLSPYVGFGAHYWNRGLTGTGSYTEHYLFYYIPVGARFEQKISGAFSYAVDVAYHFNLGGTIGISDSPGYQDTTGPLGKAGGVKVKVPLNYQINPHIALNLTPFYEWFRIGEGAQFAQYPTTSGDPSIENEPSSSSNFFGAHLGGTFSF